MVDVEVKKRIGKFTLVQGLGVHETTSLVLLVSCSLHIETKMVIPTSREVLTCLWTIGEI